MVIELREFNDKKKKKNNNTIQVHCYAAYIQQCLLSEHKHSKQNDDIYTVQCVSARKPSSAVHTQLAVVNCVCTAEEGFRAETYCTVYISSFCLLCLCSERRHC